MASPKVTLPIAGALAALLIFQICHRASRIEKVPNVETEPVATKPAPILAPNSEIKPITREAESSPPKLHDESKRISGKDTNTENPDLFAKRILNLPKPKSMADLKAHITDYVEPRLEDGSGDGDVTSIYRGYYLTVAGKLAKLQIHRSPHLSSVAMELPSGEYREWPSDKIKIKNFNSDPYSLVIFLPGKQALYLKFFSRRQFPTLDRDWPDFRSYEGWLLPSRQPVILVDRFEPFREPGQDLWPNMEVLRSLMAGVLPEN